LSRIGIAWMTIRVPSAVISTTISSRCGVRADEQPTVGVFSGVFDRERMVDCVDDVVVGDAVLARRVVNLHLLIVIRKDASRCFLCPVARRAGVEREIERSDQRPKEERTMESVLLDAARHRRSPATMPGYHQGRAPRNKGVRYPADPPTIEEIIAVVRAADDGPDGARLCALIVMLSRARRRISEALDLAETDLDRSRGAVLVRRGKGGKRREVGMDRWTWDQLQPWLEIRRNLPVGALLCVVHGATAGRRWEPSAARKQLRRTAAHAGVRRRFAPHQLRHAHAIEMAHEGVPLVVIQRQLGHANLGITSIYLQGIDSSEIIATVHSRPAPVITASAGLIGR
jgi:integrase